MSAPILSVCNLAKYFGANKVLKDINLEVDKGDVISIIGPSGSGKSTFLRCLDLLETPTRGTLSFNNEVYFNINACKDDFVDYKAYNTALAKYEEELIRTEDEVAIWANKLIEHKDASYKENLNNAKKEFKEVRKNPILKRNFYDEEGYKNTILENPNIIVDSKEINHIRSVILFSIFSFWFSYITDRRTLSKQQPWIGISSRNNWIYSLLSYISRCISR